MKKLVVLLLLMLVLVGGSVMSSHNNHQDLNLRHETNLSDKDDLKKLFDDLGLPDIGEVSLKDDLVVIPKTSKNI